MKVLLVAVAAALLLPLAGPALAQTPSSEGMVRLLEDQPGDVKARVAGTPQDPAGRWQAADLRSLDVREGAEEFTFRLAVASLKTDPEVPALESEAYAIQFRHNDRVFSIQVYRQVVEGASYYAGLYAFDGGRYPDQLSPRAPVTVDKEAGTLTLSFARDLLIDRQGNVPHPEVPFTGWQAASSQHIQAFNFCPSGQVCVNQVDFEVGDRMPDSGNGTADLPIQFGILQSTRARLASEIPTRASNGEATTFVYQVEGQNHMGYNETFLLSASNLPTGWQVKLPAQRIRIPGNESVIFPVLLTVPFVHQHGTYQKFLLEMKSQHEATSVGRIQLGVRYTNPPQPAGHHATVWLHSKTTTNDAVFGAVNNGFGGQPPQAAYINAAEPENDPRDEKIDVPSRFLNQNGAIATYSWTIPLSPALELGLDFNNDTGKISVPLKTILPMQGATLGGRIVYLPNGGDLQSAFFGFFSRDSVILADLQPGAAVDIAPNTAGKVLEASIVARPEGDYVPYAKGASIYVDLRVSFTRVEVPPFNLGPKDAPTLQPGGQATLPLNEYHDKVAQVFASNTTLVLSAAGAQDRNTNPGKTVLFNLTLANNGLDPLTADLELTGTHLAWTSLLTPKDGKVKLEGGTTTTVQVVVRVPADADKGDTADLVLSATSADDLNVRSLARLYATVDTVKQWPDDAATVAAIEGLHAQKKTPGLELPLLLAGLACLALARRRLL